MRILAVFAFLGLFIFFFDDPLNLFNVFPKAATAKIIAIILNALFIFFPKDKLSKNSITIIIVIESIITCYFFWYVFQLV